jgi:diguanylate cyclase (GGDEF)-like protein
MPREQNIYNPVMACSLLDVISISKINDPFGHTIGDELLLTIVTTIKNSVRKTNFMARLGGDGFAIFLVEAGSEASTLGRSIRTPLKNDSSTMAMNALEHGKLQITATIQNWMVINYDRTYQ